MTLESGASSGPWRPLHEAAGAGGGPHGHGGAVPGLQPTVLVAPPKLEPQPWVGGGLLTWKGLTTACVPAAAQLLHAPPLFVGPLAI